MNSFDYTRPTELYAANGRRGGRPSMTYRRFETAAKAIQYSIEELPLASLRSIALEVAGERYQHIDIRKLYDADAYPLRRRPNGQDPVQPQSDTQSSGVRCKSTGIVPRAEAGTLPGAEANEFIS